MAPGGQSVGTSGLTPVCVQGSDASAEEVPEAVWSPTEVGPEVSGSFTDAEEK